MTRSIPVLAAAWLLPAISPAGAAETADDAVQWVTPSNWRLEIALGAHAWPSLGELTPLTDGGFDEAGLDLNFAAHWAAMRFANSDLLAGVDLGVFSNESSVSYVFEDLSASGAYLVPSVKWMFGGRHRYSLDAGIGYYALAISEISGGFYNYFETEVWDRSAVGGYLGATVDFNGGRPGHGSGLMLAMKVHFFDAGTVQDDYPLLPPALGGDAGQLGGPVYSLLVGYRWR